MAANPYLKARTGPPKKYATPAALWKECVKYFKWVEDNPLVEAKPFAFQGDVNLVEVPKMRAMTMKALCLFLGISHPTWTKYKKDPKYAEVQEQVEDIIYVQKFEGAAAEFFNINIIARELGLSDKAELSGPGGGPVEIIERKIVRPKNRNRNG